MSEITYLKRNDCCEIEKLWTPVFGKEFALLEGKLEKYLFDDPDLYRDGCFTCKDKDTGELMGMIAVKLSGEKELYPDTAWISIFFVNGKYQRKGIGRRLYKASEDALRRKGVKEIYLGQEYRNFFSGIPSPCEYKDKFFKKLGFELNEDIHYDLEADIIHNSKIDEFDAESFEKEFYTETLKEHEEQKLYDFLAREFPGRWEVEAKDYLNNDNDRFRIVLLKDRSKDDIKGYCMLQAQFSGYYGLGPIGIAEEVRGRRIGDYILRQSLLQLRRLGAETICINWTILKDFYGKFNFVPVRTYRGGIKKI